MPAELLFDLSHIDFNHVAMTPEEVARINPQCGPMRQIDHVIWFRDDYSQAVGVKHVRDDEFWAPYHIPGRPLMPGVLMIEAAAQLSSLMYRRKSAETRFLGFTRCDDVVFRGQVAPGQSLYLLVQEVSFKQRRFISSTQGVVDGKLVFEATVTGMTM